MSVFADFVLSMAQIALAIPPIVAVSYLAVTANFPLVDDTLSHWDRALFGFDWDAASAWVAARPQVDRILVFEKAIFG